MADDPGTSDLGSSRGASYFQVYHVPLPVVIRFPQFRRKILGGAEQGVAQVKCMPGRQSAGRQKDACLMLSAQMIGIKTIIHKLFHFNHGVLGIRQLHRAVASSTMRISSSVRPYNSYTNRSISSSVAEI